MAMTKKEKDYYRALLDQDYREAPLTDEQLGEQAGIKSVNNVVEPINKLMKTGEPLRTQHSQWYEDQAEEDEVTTARAKKEQQELYDKQQFNEVPQAPIDFNQMGPATPPRPTPIPLAQPGDYKPVPLRNPSSQNIIEDGLFGKETGQIPTLPALSQPSNYVEAPNAPSLLDDARKETTKVNVPLRQSGSTAPKVVTEEEVAGTTRGTKEKLESDFKGAPNYWELQKQAGEAKYSATEESARDQAMRLEDQRSKLQEMMDDNSAREAEAMQRAEKQASEIKQLDPDRVWNNKSIWSKLALVAGAALQGKAGSDAGLQIMQSMVTNDLKAQEAEMDAGVKRQGGLLEALKPFAKSREELMKMANSISMEIAKNYGKALEANIQRQSAPGEAMTKTVKEYVLPLYAQMNQTDSNLATASKNEQDRRADDANNYMQYQGQLVEQAKTRMANANISADDAKRLETVTSIGVSAAKLEDIENDKNFDPTSVKNAMTSYLAGKGVPGTLRGAQAEYMANWVPYYSFMRNHLTGANASPQEDERLKLLVSPDKTFTKGSIKIWQAKRAETINGMVNALNPEARLRLNNIPEIRRFTLNRAKIGAK